MITAPPTDRRRLVIENDLTIYETATLKHTLLDALCNASAVELDLSGVREIDSAGLQLLLLVKREALSANKSLSIIAPSGAVVRLMRLYEVAGWFDDHLPAGGGIAR